GVRLCSWCRSLCPFCTGWHGVSGNASRWARSGAGCVRAEGIEPVAQQTGSGGGGLLGMELGGPGGDVFDRGDEVAAVAGGGRLRFRRMLSRGVDVAEENTCGA